MSLYQDLNDAISVFENAVEREELENGPETAIGKHISSLIFRTRQAQIEINWRESLKPKGDS